MAIKDTGELYSWGWSSFAGDENDDQRFIPKPVRNLAGKFIKDVSGGRRHTLAVTNEGEVYSWGIGENYQLGHNKLDNVKFPQQVEALKGIPIKRVAAGYLKLIFLIDKRWGHSLALTEEGKVYTWGWSGDGQTGLETPEPILTPTIIKSLETTTIVDIFAGADHSICIDKDRNIFIFGRGELGQLGLGTTDSVFKPTIHELSKKHGKCITVACGFAHTIFVMESGVFGSGWNASGQLSTVGEEGDVKTARKIELQGNVEQVACGRAHTVCVLQRGGLRELISFGDNTKGTLGNGDTQNSSDPVLVEDLQDMNTLQLACGMDHSLALVEAR